MYRVIFIDIDGTLVEENKIVSQQTRETIARLKQNGKHIVLSTGRPPYHFASIAEQLEIDAFISFNGAYVSYQGSTIAEQIIDPHRVKSLVQCAEHYNHPLVFLDHQEAVSNQKNHEEIAITFNDLKLNYLPRYDPDFWGKSSLYQMMIYCSSETVEEWYADQFPDLRFVRWHELSVDIMAPQVSKAWGMNKLLKKMNIPLEETIAIGDGLNDKEMLATAGLGVAMGNAHPTILEHADMITKSVEDDGLTHIMHQLDLL